MLTNNINNNNTNSNTSTLVPSAVLSAYYQSLMNINNNNTTTNNANNNINNNANINTNSNNNNSNINSLSNSSSSSSPLLMNTNNINTTTIPPFQYQTPSQMMMPSMNPNLLNMSSGQFLNNDVLSFSQSSATLQQVRADRRMYPITDLRFGHKTKTHTTSTIIGTKGEDTLDKIYIMLRIPAIFHKNRVPARPPCSASETMSANSSFQGSVYSESSYMTNSVNNNKNNNKNNNNNRSPQFQNGKTKKSKNQNQKNTKKKNRKSKQEDNETYTSDSDSSNLNYEDEDEEEEEEDCNETYNNNYNYREQQTENNNNNNNNNNMFSSSSANPAPAACFNPNDPYVRRVDRFARVAIKRAILKNNKGNTLCTSYSVISEIKDNITKEDEENWERIGRYGDDNLAERTIDSGHYAYFIADIRFPFTDQKNYGLPNFLFTGGFQLDIEWESLDSLFEWCDSRPHVVDGGRELCSRDVEGQVKLFSSMLTEEKKEKVRRAIQTPGPSGELGKLELSWDEYVPHTEFVKNLPVDVCDLEDARTRQFSLSRFLTGSAKSIWFYVRRECNHFLKRHYDWTGNSDGRRDDPIVQYKLTRNNIDLIEWTDALEARTINFERVFEGKAPKDLRVYYDNFENLETKPFIDINNNNDVKLEIMFQRDIGRVFFHIFVQVVNVITITPVYHKNNILLGFDINSSYFTNLQVVQNLALLIASNNQTYLQQQMNNGYRNGIMTNIQHNHPHNSY